MKWALEILVKIDFLVILEGDVFTQHELLKGIRKDSTNSLLVTPCHSRTKVNGLPGVIVDMSAGGVRYSTNLELSRDWLSG